MTGLLVMLTGVISPAHAYDGDLSTPEIDVSVYDASYNPLAGATVKVYDTGDAVVATQTTDASGLTNFTTLPDGSYRVGVTAGGYVPQYYQAVSALADATPLTVDSVNGIGSSADFYLDALPQIQGTLTGPSGALAYTGQVTVYDYDAGSSTWNPVNYYYTDGAGQYAVGGLPPGNYRLGFSSAGLMTEYYDNHPTVDQADSISVTTGGAAVTADATLVAGGTITGTISGPTGLLTDYAASATAYLKDGTGSFVAYGDPAYTDSTGTYSLGGLPPGDYKVGFESSGLQSEFWNDQPDLASGDVITVTADESHTASATLSAGATISGHVTSAAGGAVSGVNVTAYQYDVSSDYWSWVTDGLTNATGDYSLGGLAAGSYRLEFSKTGFVTQYYNGKPTLNTADDVAVARNGSATANAQLLPMVAISGTVTGVGAAALAGAEVTAYDSSGGWADGTSSGTDGSYSLLVPPNASYTLVFSATDYITRWYLNAASEAAATPVAVGTTAVSGINQQLPLGGKISGVVTSTGAATVAAPSLELYQVYADGSADPIDHTTGSSSGSYTFSGLDAGTYLVRASATGWLSEFYNNAYDTASATRISVSLNTTSTANIELGAPRHITGTVTNTAHAGLAGVDVEAERKVTTPNGTVWEPFDYATTATGGGYSVPVAPGTYRVSFSKSYYRAEYYDNTVYAGRAARITVSSTADTTGINADLAALGVITGTVTNGTSALNGATARLYAYDPDSGWYVQRTVLTDSTGTYTIPGIQPGHYRLGFKATGYRTKYYANADTVETATDVTAALDQVTSGINQALGAPALHLTGTVTGPGGAAVSGAEVRVDRQVTINGQTYWSSWYGDTFTGADGKYDVVVDPGTYRVAFYADTLVTEWWDNQPTADTATPIILTTGNATADAQLAAGATVQGTVTGPAGAIADASATLLTDDPQNPGTPLEVDYTYTDSLGHYAFTGVAPGTYWVEVSAVGMQTADSTTFAATNGGTVTRDFALVATPPGPTLSGTVLAGTAPQQGAVVEVEQKWTYGSFTGWYWYDSVSTLSDGTWSVPVSAGTYRVMFTQNGFANQYWNNVGAPALATEITVSTSGVSGIDAHLVVGGTVAGNLTSSTGTSLTDGYVRLYAANGTGWDQLDSAWVDNTGHYQMDHVAPGSYRIGFSSNGYLTSYWNGTTAGASTLDAATSFTVGDGATVTKNGQLIKAAVLSGTVTGVGTQPADGAEVFAEIRQPDGTFSWADEVTADADGAWRMSLLPGTYRLHFVDEANRVAEWWNDKFTADTATLITVTNADQGGLNAQLGDGAVISGAVSFPARPAGWGSSVDLYTTTGTFVSRASVNTTDFTYEFNGLAAGSYRVRFAQYTNADAEAQWWNNVYEGNGPSAATTVTLAAAGTQTGVNATLVVGGTMTGTVTTTAGAGVSGCLLRMYSTDGSLSTRYADADTTASGAFTARGLTTGDYRISVSCPSGTYYYDGSGAMSTSSTAAVTFHTTRGTNTAAPALIIGSDPNLVNTALPTITGTPKVGSTLTATPGSWNPAPTSVAYQWKAAGSPIAGATTSTFAPGASEVGKTITVTVTASKSGYTDTAATSAPTAAVASGTLTNTSPPTISGTPQVGQAVTASAGSWSPQQDSVAYQWKTNGTAVSGATTASYTPVAGDVGKTLTVTVTATKAGYADASATSAGAAVLDATAQVVANQTWPVISGNAVVGQTLSATSGSWNPTPDSVAYQWKAAGAPITGATAATYVPVSGDVGKTITVTVTATKAGYIDGTATSDATSAVTQPAVQTVTNVTAPKVTGTAKVGLVLTASPGTWNPSTATTKLQWLRAGTPISGATATTYKLTAADLGKAIAVRVTASQTGYTSGTATSAATPAVGLGTLRCTVKITGTPKVGKTLKAATSCLPTGATMKYQWYRGTTKIKKATKASYKVTTTDKGKKLSVKVTFAMPGYQTLTVKSAAVKIR